jgi:hypothetical protein
MMGGKMRRILIGIMVLALMLTGCQYLQPAETGPTGDIVFEDNLTFITDEEEDDLVSSIEEEEVFEEEIPESVAFTVTKTEGELIDLNELNLVAEDPDGDPIEYTFSEPFNENGRWQTNIGDEGKYLVTITASDGELTTSEDIQIVVTRANRPPVIECPEMLTVMEGDTVNLDCNIYDEEGDAILVGYDGWMQSSSYETTYDDAGEYIVFVRASDKVNKASVKIDVVVEDVNRPPMIDDIEDITLMETETVQITPEVSDPDGDIVTVSFSAPLDENGEWMTVDGDAGVHEVTVYADDGTDETTLDVMITVTNINTAPVLKEMDDIEVDEGETIVLPINAYDPEGDELTIIVSGWMDSEEYETTYDDAGEYDVTVTVSDGVLSASQDVHIIVNNVNRPPVFRRP